MKRKVGVLKTFLRAQTEWNRATKASLSFDDRGAFLFGEDGGKLYWTTGFCCCSHIKGGYVHVEANERGYRCHI
jgi:hypothetical protein